MTNATQAQTTAIAKFLNVAPAAIKEVQVWAYVYFVKFATGRPTFVSRKIKVEAITITQSYETMMGDVLVRLSNGESWFVENNRWLYGKKPSMKQLVAPQGTRINPESICFHSSPYLVAGYSEVAATAAKYAQYAA